MIPKQPLNCQPPHPKILGALPPLLNIVAPGRYPFETLEVVSAASEEPSEQAAPPPPAGDGWGLASLGNLDIQER